MRDNGAPQRNEWFVMRSRLSFIPKSIIVVLYITNTY